MTGLSEAAGMLHWKYFLLGSVYFNLVLLPDSLGLSWIPSFEGSGRSAWLHVQVASEPQNRVQPGGSDLHSLSCTSLRYVSSSAHYTRLKKQTNPAGFPDAVAPARTQTVQSLECKTVPENSS